MVELLVHQPQHELEVGSMQGWESHSYRKVYRVPLRIVGPYPTILWAMGVDRALSDDQSNYEVGLLVEALFSSSEKHHTI
jgi:hypothetical protein